MKFEKYDRFWMGLSAGIVFPMILYFLYWAFFHHQLSFPTRFYHYLLGGQLLSNVVKLCGLGNLLLFYIALRNKFDRFNKGVIVSVLLYVLLVAYITYYMEPKYL